MKTFWMFEGEMTKLRIIFCCEVQVAKHFIYEQDPTKLTVNER